MKILAPLFAVISLSTLCACTNADWDHAMRYAGVDEAQDSAPVAPPAPPAPVQPAEHAQASADFCQAVARQDADGTSFDEATRQRMFQQSFRQCMTLFGSADTPIQTARSQ